MQICHTRFTCDAGVWTRVFIKLNHAWFKRKVAIIVMVMNLYVILSWLILAESTQKRSLMNSRSLFCWYVLSAIRVWLKKNCNIANICFEASTKISNAIQDLCYAGMFGEQYMCGWKRIVTLQIHVCGGMIWILLFER